MTAGYYNYDIVLELNFICRDKNRMTLSGRYHNSIFVKNIVTGEET